MATLKDFHKEILPDVQGCPLSILNNALLNAIIEFCRRSQIWKAESAATDVTAGEPRYAFSPSVNERVVSIDHATFEGKKLVKTSQHDLDQDSLGWRDQTSKTPVSYFIENPDIVRLVGTPSEDVSEALRIYVTLCPSKSATEVPDWLYEDWSTTIAHGALAKLHSMSNKSWANAGMVGWHERKFRSGTSTARSKTFKSFLTLGQEILPQPFTR